MILTQFASLCGLLPCLSYRMQPRTISRLFPGRLLCSILLFAFQLALAQHPAYMGVLINKGSSEIFSDAVAIDIDLEGHLYIVDYGRHQLLKYSQKGELLKQIGGYGNGTGQFDGPRDVNASGLNIFVADYQNRRVVRLDKNLNYLSDFSSNWNSPYHFEEIISIAVSDQQDLFILENSEKKIVKFSRFSEPTASFGGRFETFGQLLEPSQMVINGARQVFVCDPAQQIVAVFDYLGNYVTDIRHPKMEAPGALHWGVDQRLYVIDSDGEIFIFDNTLRHVKTLRLQLTPEGIRDVALYYDKRAGSKQLFALSPRRCHIYQIQETARQ